MLPDTPQPSESYDHNHFKKFWLMQTISENESLALLSPSMFQGFNSSSHANDGKQLRTSSSTCMRPSTLPIKPVVTRAFCGGVFPCNPRRDFLTRAGGLLHNSNEQQNFSNFAAHGHDSARNAVPTSGLPLKPVVCRASIDQGLPFKNVKPPDPNSDDATRSLLTEIRPSGFCYSHLRPVSHVPGDDVDTEAISYNERFPTGCFKANSSLEELFGYVKGPERTNKETFEKSRADKCGLEACNDENCLSPAGDQSLMTAEKSSPEDTTGLLYLSLAAEKADGEVCPENLPGPDKLEQNPNQEPKTCSTCGTSKTPLWRSGPEGPKSLCNACGIRFTKSKRWNSSSENHDLSVSPSPQSSPDSKFKTLLRGQKRKKESCNEETENVEITENIQSESLAPSISQQVQRSLINDITDTEAANILISLSLA